MWHIRRSMKQSMDTMTTVTPDYRVTIRLSVLLNNISDLSVFLAWLDQLYSFLKTLPRNSHKFLSFFVDITDKQSFVQVSVKTFVVHSNIYIK